MRDVEEDLFGPGSGLGLQHGSGEGRLLGLIEGGRHPADLIDTMIKWWQFLLDIDLLAAT
jgi:hypothetical protein